MKNKIAIISEETFQITLIAYLVMLLIENFKHGFISTYFNLNYLLVIVVISSVIMVYTRDKSVNVKKQCNYWNYLYMVILCSVGGGFTFLKIHEYGLGVESYVLPIFSVSLIALTSYLIYIDKDTK